MAFGKRWDGEFESYNGSSYTIEIWQDGWTGGTLDFKLGKGGVKLKYDSDGDEKFAPIKTSRCSFNFLIENALNKTFIEQLRDGLEERDVYVHIYDDITSTPFWSGFILMDLSSEEDEIYPYEVTLTAVDGISLLKDIDFVPDTTEISPYLIADTYMGTASNQETFIYWIKEILSKGGMSTTSEGASSNYNFATSVNWYNAQHPGTGISDDPLALTQISPQRFYKKEDEDSSVVKYEAINCYKLLKNICEAWGMRVVYWHHTFYFTQISEYDKSETGTVADKININTRYYNLSGTNIANYDAFGNSYYESYDQPFENSTSPGEGIQKLTGTKYQFYPTFKTVKTNFLSISDINYFQGFPLLATDYTPYQTKVVESNPVGVFTDAIDTSNFFQSQITLAFNNQSGATVDMEMNWSYRAREAGTSTWTKMLDFDYSTSTMSWVSYNEPDPLSGNYLTMFQFVTVPTGITNIDITQFSGYVPFAAAFTGDWEIEFYTIANTTASGATLVGHGAIGTSFPSVVDVDYSNISVVVDPGASFFSPVVGGVIGTTSNLISVTTQENSYTYKIDDLKWGDVNGGVGPAALRVYNGTTWGPTSFVGYWGDGVLTGTESFTELLAHKILNNHQQDSYKTGFDLAVSVNGKIRDDGTGTERKFINPIGRVLDTNGIPYVFVRGDFDLEKDQVKGDWFQYTTDSPTTTTTTTGSNGILSGNAGTWLGGGNTSGGAAGGGNGPSPRLMQPSTTLSAPISKGSSPITTIDINAIGSDVYKTGDVLEIFDELRNIRQEFTLSADQSAADTSLSINSLTLTYDFLDGSLIRVNDLDLSQQYQNKTRGTVGGLAVTSTEIGPLHSDGNIDGVDTEYIKILPRDFMPNDDQYNKGIAFDETATTGVKVYSADTELWAFVQIPYGKEATDCEVYGNNTKVVDVFELSIDASGIGTAVATGSVGTSFRISTPVGSDTVNYLGIRVTTTGTAQRIYGGKIILTDI
jgi:hypothetical protein